MAFYGSSPYTTGAKLQSRGYTGQVPTQGTPQQLGNALNFYQGGSGVGLAQSQNQAGDLFGQLLQGAGQYQYGSDLANRDYSLNNQLLGIQGQQNALDVSGYQRQLGLQNQLAGLANQGFDLSSQQAQNQAGIQTRGQISQGTANGALQTQGTRQQLGDIQSNLSNQLGQIGVNRQQTALGFENTKAGLQQSIANANLMGKQLGVKGSQLTNALNDSLKELGLSQYTSAQQIANNYSNLNPQDQALLMQIGQSALARQGLFPQNGK